MANVRCGCDDPEMTKVTLERKSRGRSLGIRLVDTEVGLMIACIREEGVFIEWNARNPSTKVAPGDIVVETNGLTAPWAIMEELAKATTLDMAVRRAPTGERGAALLARCKEVTDQSLWASALILERTVQASESSVDTCAICLEDVEADDRVAGLQCGHGFHQRCILKWLGRPGSSGCPLCRGSVC
jgi:hypothetical protein